VIYGPAQVYDMRYLWHATGQAFGEVRVGVSTLFLKNEIQPLFEKSHGTFRRSHLHFSHSGGGTF